MGRDRTERRKRSSSGMGRFVALPHSVLDSPAYRSLSHPARSLLLDTARQFTGKNNGSLVCTPKYLRPLGWKSNDTITAALRQLLSASLIIETRKGRFPNTPAWFALGWLVLDVREGLDIDPDQYRSGAYLGAPLIPSGGTRGKRIAPSGGKRAPNVAPSGGAIFAHIDPAPIPPDGEYLHHCHLQEPAT